MSYTSAVRNMLLHTEIKRKCCLETELYVYSYILGVKAPAKSAADGDAASGPKVRRSFSNEDLASRLTYIESRLLGDGRAGRGEGFLLADGGDAGHSRADNKKYRLNADAVDSYFRLKKYGDPREPDTFIVKECCAGAVMRAFFALSGSISPPENSSCYLEFYFEEEKAAAGFRALLEKAGIKSSVTKRRSRFVCYVKKAESVCDILTMMALPGESIKFQVAKTGREVSNSVNRVLNCDLANIDRAREKGMAEADAILFLDSRDALKTLPEDLVRLSELRLKNPEASHGEIGRMMIPELSHSSVSLKMKKIIALAESLS